MVTPSRSFRGLSDKRRCVLLLVAGFLLLCATASAQTREARARRGPSPIPPPSADRVAVDPVIRADFDSLRDFLSGFSSEVGAEYQVCIVDLSDGHGRPGREHAASAIRRVDEVFDAWRSELHPERHVLVLLALRNRGIAVHPGSDWAALGFERRRIKEVIDRSAFPVHARAGNYPSALKELILAVDAHLSGYAKQERVELGLLGQALGTLTTLADTLEAELQRARFHARDGQDLLDRARGELAAAKVLVEREHVINARASQAAAGTHLAELQRLLENGARIYSESAGRRSRALARIESLRTRSRGSGELEPGLAARLLRIEASVATAAERQDWRDDPAEIDALLQGAETSLDVLDAELTAFEDQRRFRRITMPLMLLAIPLVIGFGWVARARWRRKDRFELAVIEVEHWRRLLGRAASRLVSLEDEHPRLFGGDSFADRFQGRTARSFEAMAERIDELFLSFATAQGLVTESETLIENAGALDWKSLELARETLTNREVVIGEERLPGVHLFLPDTRPVTRRAGDLLISLAEGYEEAVAEVARLEDLLGRIPDRHHALTAELGESASRLNSLADSGIRPLLLRDELVALQRRAGKLDARLERDPEEFESEQVEALDAAQDLRARCARADKAMERATLAATETLATHERALADHLSREGSSLGEPGFEPEAMRSAVRRAHRATREALSASRVEDAVTSSEEARDRAEELGRLIASSLAARESVPGRLEALDTRLAELKEQLPELRDRIAALSELHAEDSLTALRADAGQAEVPLAFVADCLETARQNMSRTRRHYLAAAELSSRAEEAVQDFEELRAEVEGHETRLEEARTEGADALARARTAWEALAPLLDEAREVATRTSREAAELFAEELQREQDLQDEDRPHWLERADRSARLQLQGERLATDLQEQVEAARKLEERRERVTREIRAVRSLLDNSELDRWPSNERLLRAERTLDSFARRLDSPAGDRDDPRTLLHVVDEAGSLAAESRRLAEADFAAARQVRTALASAAFAEEEVDRVHEFGIVPDLTSARLALDRARAALADQRYETALQAAGEARQAAAEAERTAQRQVSQARIRRSTSLAVPNATSGSSGLGSFSGGGFSGGSGFGSSSGGSSFGGSSSGGSSW